MHPVTAQSSASTFILVAERLMNFYSSMTALGLDDTTDFDEFTFEVKAALSAAASLGKAEEKRAAAAARSALEGLAGLSDQECERYLLTNAAVPGDSEEDAAAKESKTAGAKLIYSLLVLTCKGYAREVVRGHNSENGVSLWRKFEKRLGKTSGVAAFSAVLNYRWSEDFPLQWDKFVNLVAKLPAGAIHTAGLKALAMRGARQGGRTALETHINLQDFADWGALVKRVDEYLAAERQTYDMDPPPDQSALRVTAEDLRNRCLCCGSSDHRRTECPKKTWTCSRCGIVGHIGAVCMKSAKGEKGKGKGSKGATKGKGEPGCWTCGRPGHQARNCPNARGYEATEEREPAAQTHPMTA